MYIQEYKIDHIISQQLCVVKVNFISSIQTLFAFITTKATIIVKIPRITGIAIVNAWFCASRKAFFRSLFSLPFSFDTFPFSCLILKYKLWLCQFEMMKKLQTICSSLNCGKYKMNKKSDQYLLYYYINNNETCCTFDSNLPVYYCFDS